MTYIAKDRKNEQGVTMVLVAVALVSVLAMAALAVDVLALYVARSEAQRAADAGALAAAKMFAFSGYTSNLTGSGITQAQLCVNGGAGSTAAANKAAESVLSQNTVTGQAATLTSINCDFTQTENPRVKVTVQRTGLPVLFGRIWSTAASSVSATASAEAFNPSGGTVPIEVASVKPWLINNDCSPSCGGPFYFTSTYGLVNNGLFIGNSITLTEVDAAGGAAPTLQNQFYALDPPQPNLCPSNSAVQCNNIGTGPPGIFYHDNIACSNTAFRYSCGQQIGPGQPVLVDARVLGNLKTRTEQGTQCLIHSFSTYLNQGQDVINAGPPITIDGGANNPNPALHVTNISRSDSVVTVPVYAGSNLCPGGTCNVTATVMGFLQLGIQDVSPPGQQGAIQAVIMNASACNPANTGAPVTGGALSAIPVRLIHQ
jgi:Putative Flp pilus-assembly TadE/G-like